MNINTPLVSVITVVYNNAELIEKTLLSVINQTYERVEYIVIDGGSTDGTLDILKKYDSQISYWVSEPDKGIYDAMNKGIAAAKGEWIGLINSGDSYEPHSIATVIKAAWLNPRVDIFHGLLRVSEIDGTISEVIGHNSSYLTTGMIEHPTCFVRKKTYDIVGHFNLSYKSSADYDFMLRARKLGISFMLIEAILANFTKGGISSSLLAIRETKEIKYQHKMISYLKKEAAMIFYRLINRS